MDDSKLKLDLAQAKFDIADTAYKYMRHNFYAGQTSRADFDLAYLELERSFSELKSAQYQYAMMPEK